MSAGKPRVITLSDGETQVPSVFAIDEAGNEIVGSAARDQAGENPLGTVIAAKRLSTSTASPSTTRDKVFTYEMVEGADDTVLLNVAEQRLHPRADLRRDPDAHQGRGRGQPLAHPSSRP